MSDDFRVGDIVECVDDRPSRGIGGEYPIKGGLYTVTGVLRFSAGFTGLLLRELDPKPANSFYARRFRKVHRPRAEFLTELLTAPVNLPEREPA